MPSARTQDQHPLLTAHHARPRALALVGTLFLQTRRTTASRAKTASNSRAPLPRSAGRRDRCRILRTFPSVFCVLSRSVQSSCDSSSSPFVHSLAVIRLQSSASHPFITHHTSSVTRLGLHSCARHASRLGGLRGGVAAAAACCRRRCCWCWSNFNPRHNLATRVHTTHLFWSLPPSPQRSCWSHPLPQAKPTLAWPPRLVSTLPATNLPLETRHTCTSGPAFSHLGSARDPRLVS